MPCTLLLAAAADGRAAVFAFRQYRVASGLGRRPRFGHWLGGWWRCCAGCLALHIHDLFGPSVARAHHFASRAGCAVHHRHRKASHPRRLDLALNLRPQLVAVAGVAGRASQGNNSEWGELEHGGCGSKKCGRDVSIANGAFMWRLDFCGFVTRRGYAHRPRGFAAECTQRPCAPVCSPFG
jgi:hypothetical protein